MTFDVAWSPKARDHLAGLDRETQVRVIRKVVATREEPPRYFKRLVGEPLWRLRVGDYRVVAEIDAAGRRLVILAIGHRKNIY